MEVKYRQNFWNILWFNLYQFPRMLSVQIITLLTLLIIGYGFFNAPSNSDKPLLVNILTFITITLVFFLIQVIVLVFSVIIFQLASNRQRLKMNSECKFTVSEIGIAEQESTKHTEINWSGIKKVSQTRNFILVYDSVQSAFVIPKKYFTNRFEAKAFFDYTYNFWKLSKEKDKMSDNNKVPSSFPWSAILGFLGVIIAAYIGYLGMRAPIEIPIQATQTAEARQTSAAQLFGLTPSSNTIDTTPTIETISNSQPTETLNNYADPVKFVQNYFSLLNQRKYQEAWSKLSEKFRENFSERGAGGYNEYVAFWDTVEQVEIASMEIVSQNDNEALIYVEIVYFYKAGYSTTGHTTYKVVKDLPNASWLFNPN